MPSARQTDVFADGQVQIVEFEVPEGADAGVVGRPLRDARIPEDSRVLALIRESVDDPARRRGRDPRRRPDRRDRLAERGARVGRAARPRRGRASRTSSSSAAARWARRSRGRCSDQGIGVRVIEPALQRAREVAEELPDCRVFNATGIDPDFLERERIGRAQAAVFALREDPQNHYAATLARVHGVPLHDRGRPRHDLDRGLRALAASTSPSTRGPVTAEEIVRFAHDPRTQQVAMLEGEPLRGPRHHDPADERVRRPAVPRHADPRRADRRDRARRQGAVPAQRRGPPGRATA